MKDIHWHRGHRDGFRWGGDRFCVALLVALLVITWALW